MTDFLKISGSQENLGRRAIRGGFFFIASRVSIQVARFAFIMIMARVLTPEDFGLIAMIASIIGFVSLFGDFGLSMATVQRPQITHENVNTLFWMNFALGITVTLIVILMAPALVWFYAEPRLLWLTVTLAAGFLFAGLTVQHHALLQRQLRFGTLAAITIAGSLFGMIVSVIAALNGAGIWALVYLPLTDGFFRAAAMWIACPWRPCLKLYSKGVGGMLMFGGNLTGYNAVNYFSRNTDKVLIGWFWGAAALGLYSKAYELMLFPIRQTTAAIFSVAVPTLSRLQDNPPRYRHYYLKAVWLIAFVTMPAVMYLILMSDEVITFVLGKKWAGVSPIFSVLGISALIQPIMLTTDWLFISSGNTKRMFKWGIFSSLCTVTSFFIGLPFGVIAVAASYTICVLLLVVPLFWYSSQRTPVDLADIFGAIFTPAMATLIAGAALLAAKLFLPAITVGAAGLAITFLLTTFVYLVICCILAGGFDPLSEIIAITRKMAWS